MNTSHKHGNYAESREKNSGLSTFKKFTVVSVIGIAAAISMMTAASDSRIAYITDGNDTYTVTTMDTAATDILEKAGIELKRGDEAVVTEESHEQININIIRAFSVKVSADGGARFLNVTGGTVADALRLSGYKVSENDFVTPSRDYKLESDMKIEVVRGVKIHLVCGSEEQDVYVPSGKLGESLDFIGYELSENDKLNVDINTSVYEGMTVEVDKVQYRLTTKKEKLEPNLIEESCDTLPLGESVVKQEGKEGSVEVTYKEKYVNNELVEKNTVSEKVVVKPTDKIVLIGTKQLQTSQAESENNLGGNESGIFADFGVKPDSSLTMTESLDSSADEVFGSGADNSGTGFTYSKLIVGTCTAYTELDGITAIGTVPRVGAVAVDPSIIPYGTRLYICSADGSYVYGYAVAEDTGSAALAGDIVVDLYMNSEAECQAFGRQELCIYILD